MAIDLTQELKSLGPQYSGIREVVAAGEQIRLARTAFPWLDRETVTVDINKVEFQDCQFYLGDLIEANSRLAKVYASLSPHTKQIASKVFCCHIRAMAQENSNSDVRRIDAPRSKFPIFYFKNNPNDERIYVVRPIKFEGLPVVLRVAACEKRNQKDVLSVISYHA